MAVRTTFGRRSRQSGEQIGVTISTFGLDKLSEITGEDLAAILLDAAQPSYDEAYENWPVLTGASRDSIELEVVEKGERLARVRLQAGGQKLIDDSRNRSHRDYAPVIEFNGTPTAPAGILRNAIYDNDSEIRSRIREGVKSLIEDKLA